MHDGAREKRSKAMMAEVYTKTYAPLLPMTDSIKGVIQLSVPNSVVAKGIMIKSRKTKSGLPNDLR